MAEVDSRIDGWWKILHQDDSKMLCRELRSPKLGKLGYLVDFAARLATVTY